MRNAMMRMLPYMPGKQRQPPHAANHVELRTISKAMARVSIVNSTFIHSFMATPAFRPVRTIGA